MHYKYSIDTHPIIWYFSKRKTLSTRAKHAIDEIFTKRTGCYISTMVFLEAFHTSLKHHEFKFSYFLKELRLPNIKVVPLGKAILEECYKLPKILNIHDRIIVATARLSKTPLVTKDEIIRSLKIVDTVW